MKVAVMKTNLKEGLSITSRSVSDRVNLPILKNALLEADANNTIKITTTNLETAISYRVAGKVIEPGKITTPLTTLFDLVGNLQNERLNIDKKGHALILQTDNYEATLQGVAAEEFPLIPTVKNKDAYLEIEARVLNDALTQVLPASQFSEARQELNSILFEFLIDHITLAATDSFRLAEKTLYQTQFKNNKAERSKILIPLKTATQLTQILKDDEVVRIFYDEHQILFQTPHLDFISRLGEGNFPDYHVLVPKKFSTELTLDRQEFIGALKVAGVFSGKNGEVIVSQTANKKGITISAESDALGKNQYTLPAKIEGEIKTTTFNYRYLLDGLKSIKTSDIFFGVNDENKPALLKSHSEASFFYIVMPVMGG